MNECFLNNYVHLCIIESHNKERLLKLTSWETALAQRVTLGDKRLQDVRELKEKTKESLRHVINAKVKFAAENPEIVAVYENK